MKQHFVETSNHRLFTASVAAVENRGSPEACILLLNGEPGTGKSCTVDNWGAKRDAIYLEGIPGMSLSFLRDYLADQTGVMARGKFEQYKGMVDFFKANHQPIILDEAQHGLPNKAECIEYLRRIAEQANTLLVLVCHSSEKHRFSEHRLAHVATRVSASPELKPANVEDCETYLAELCEVVTDKGIAQQVYEQSRGRYRLMSNACRTLEVIGAKKEKTELTAADTKGIRLCEDAMKSLKREAK